MDISINPIPGKCKKRVVRVRHSRWGAFHMAQCSRNVWDEKPQDGYCKQHHPETEAARYAEAEKRYKEKREEDPLVKAFKRIKELEAEVEKRGAEVARLEAEVARLGERLYRDDWLSHNRG